MKKQLKRYTEGFGDDGDWIDNTIRVNNIKDADIVIIPGGVDIDTLLYNEPRGMFTQQPSLGRDEREIKALKTAYNEGKTGVLICRGAQLGTALAGGKLIQHVNHHMGTHDCKTLDDEIIETNSIHHQMCYPWDLPQDEYIVLSWTESLSDIYLNGYNQDIVFPEIAITDEGKIIEPEIIWYPKKRWLAIQFHP